MNWQDTVSGFVRKTLADLSVGLWTRALKRKAPTQKLGCDLFRSVHADAEDPVSSQSSARQFIGCVSRTAQQAFDIAVKPTAKACHEVLG